MKIADFVRKRKYVCGVVKEVKMKQFRYILLGLILMLGLSGCGTSQTEKADTTTKSLDKTVAINAGETAVYLDEAMYYAYTAQATYETLFISEGKEIDWNSEMKEGVSWQQGVKSTVLDDICRRECMYSLAQEYNVSLGEEDKKQIEIDVNNFFENSNEKLLAKIIIESERLKFIFEKAKIADRVEEIMTASDKNKPDVTYENWKSGNTVTAEEQWKSITFSEHIFNLEDLGN